MAKCGAFLFNRTMGMALRRWRQNAAHITVGQRTFTPGTPCLTAAHPMLGFNA
jgi:hypothetical protein